MATRKEIIEKSIRKEKDLSDEQTQSEILSPNAVEANIAGKTVALYPLSGYDVRRLTGLAQQVLAAAFGIGPMEMRICGVLTEEQYLSRFLPLLAAATFASPKDIKREQLAKVMNELNESTACAQGTMDIANAFAIMLEQNEVMAVLGGPAKKDS